MRRFCAVVFCLCFLLCFVINCFAKTAPKSSSITAASAIVVDLKKNKIVYSRSIHAKRAPASTLKILTALIALEKLGPDASVTISRKASLSEPSKIWLKPGEKYRSLDLIKAVLICSANDASVALAEAVAGSESQFAKMMNKKARSLGAKNSNFINASGLPAKNQYSTVYDLYRITKAALKNPVINQIMQKKKTAIQNSDGREISLVNHNKLLFRMTYPLVLGKTGYTKTARHCYASIAYFENKEYAIVILKSRKPWTDMENLLKLIRNRK
ncbi:MAG: D-alanyl-D-alanine carboxypeptidase [Candidatus Omnitrophica bacterium]|nr:D-alanyl-D-alanine carboxypeptidase [Candidatus Omnitrophota bacterium]